MNMNLTVSTGILNFIFVAVVLWSIASGYKNGLLIKVISLFGLFVMGILAWNIAPSLSQVIHIVPKDLIISQGTLLETVLYEFFNQICIFIVIWIIGCVLVALLKPLLKMFHYVPVLSTLNRWLGALFGFGEGILLLMIVVFVLQMPMVEHGKEMVEDSWLSYVEPVSEHVLFFASDAIEQIQTMNEIKNEGTSLSQEKIETLYEWLVEQGVSKEKVEEIIQSLS